MGFVVMPIFEKNGWRYKKRGSRLFFYIAELFD